MVYVFLADGFEEIEGLICPANLPHLDPRAGCATVDLGRCAVTVINLSGVAFLEPSCLS